jgi:isopentenyl-diphosphate Delta-isomerase
VLVDSDDRPVGLRGKVEAHLGEGQLHRAFTALVFNPTGRVLAARRSRYKMLWPLVWDGSCASHVRTGESYRSAGERRLREELGFTCPLREVDKFIYRAPYKSVGVEYEICTTLTGNYQGEVQANPDEISEWVWADVHELIQAFGANPESHVPWFVLALSRLVLGEQLGPPNGLVLPVGGTPAFACDLLRTDRHPLPPSKGRLIEHVVSRE